MDCCSCRIGLFTVQQYCLCTTQLMSTNALRGQEMILMNVWQGTPVKWKWFSIMKLVKIMQSCYQGSRLLFITLFGWPHTSVYILQVVFMVLSSVLFYNAEKSQRNEKPSKWVRLSKPLTATVNLDPQTSPGSLTGVQQSLVAAAWPQHTLHTLSPLQLVFNLHLAPLQDHKKALSPLSYPWMTL